MIRDLDECDRIASELETDITVERRVELLERLVVSHSVFNMELGRGSVFWRARKCDASGYTKEELMTYPPSHITGTGRFNDRREPSLYLSTRRETALAEIGTRPGDYVQVAGFRIRESESVRPLLVGEWLHVHKRGYMRIGDKSTATAISKAMNSFPRSQGRLYTYIDAILGDLMARRDAHTNDYLTTRLLTKILYKKLPATNGVLYPSVKDDLGTNLAIRAEVADKAFEICSSTVYSITSARRFSFYDYTPVQLASGVQPDGTFEWTNPSGSHEMLFFRLTAQEAAKNPASILDLTSK